VRVDLLAVAGVEVNAPGRFHVSDGVFGGRSARRYIKEGLLPWTRSRR